MAKYKLGDIFELQMGKTPSRSNELYWNNGEYNWISISDLDQDKKYISNTKEKITNKAVLESGIKKIPSNTVVMSFKLSIGKTAITSHDMFSNEAIMAFKDKHLISLNRDYIYYLLQTVNWNKNANKAVKGRTINKKIISQTEVEIPNYETQVQIVKILDLISKRLRLENKVLNKLDTLIKARFVEMFSDPGSNNKEFNIKKLGEVCVLNPKKNTESNLFDNLRVSFVPMSSVSEKGDMNLEQTKLYSEVKKGFTYFSD